MLSQPGISLQERYRGALFGLAVGDAVGTTLENQRNPPKELHTDMIGGGPFHLLPGQWTDGKNIYSTKNTS